MASGLLVFDVVTMLKKFTLLLCALLLTFSVTAATGDAPTANMQRTTGGVLQSVMSARGVAANDPRYYNTLYEVGKTATATAAGLGTGALVAGTSPAWGSLVAFAAVSAAVSYGITFAVDSAVKYFWGTDPATVTVQSPVYVTADPTQTFLVGQSIVRSGSAGSYEYKAYANGTTNTSSSPVVSYYNCGTSPFGNVVGCNVMAYLPLQGYSYAAGYQEWTTGTFFDAYKAGNSSPVTPSKSATGQTTTATKSTSAALASDSSSEASSPVAYGTTALVIDQLWKTAAATSGYTGVPYDSAQPVTSEQVQAWANSNPSSYASVSSLTTPSTGSGLVPSKTTSASVAVEPVTSAVTSTVTDSSSSTSPSTSTVLCGLAGLSPCAVTLSESDPGVSTPTLDATPTASSVLSPLLSLLPDFKSYSVPSHSASCPRPAFSVFGTTVTMDSHCTLFEGQRAALYAAMVLAFTLVSIFIILSA